jgi:hypothetical protein
MRGVYLAILLAVLASGCTRQQPGHPVQLAVVSPNGEPLGRAGDATACEELLGNWFSRADRDHDGRLSEAEWLADSDTWFGRADADHDGFVTVSELTLLRRSLEPAGSGQPQGNSPGNSPGNPRDTRSRTVIDRSPDPVMAADTNLDFRVSAAEARLLSERRYALKARDGAVERGAVLSDCRRY